ncbi:hypothetical protein AB0K09_16970 [Streptomyces sp. NPDC049577]|uniref:hypothetical protein n=1 Tax=Streptomyces sp. NPDC049577 TaxID=3155153 RepID=UPI00343B2672
MSDQTYTYFVEVPEGYTPERPDGLWRRAGDEWQYLSLLDWQWHRVENAAEFLPAQDVLQPVTAERAAELQADRQLWVRYWARYTDEAAWRDGERPTTVVRRRRSPERIYDEAFKIRNVWGPTPAVFEFFDPRPSNPPHLVEISADEAEQLLQELRGVTGATEL